MEVHTVRAVADFIARIEEIGLEHKPDTIFRGQRTDDPLAPKLLRLVKPGLRLHIEKLMFEEFTRNSTAFTRMRLQDEWDLLAVAQHHGLPTRLLDWTYSALAALWFAVERGPVSIPTLVEGKITMIPRDGVVWMLKTLPSDFMNKSDSISPFENKRTFIYRPNVITERIAAQRGIFVVHHIFEDEEIVEFQVHSKFYDRLVKFTIPANAFLSLRKHLDACGVNEGTLFPDLVGLCKHLSWRFTELPKSSIHFKQTARTLKTPSAPLRAASTDGKSSKAARAEAKRLPTRKARSARKSKK